MKTKITYFTNWVDGLLVYAFVQLFLFSFSSFFFLILSLVLSFLNGQGDVLWWVGLFGYRLDCWLFCFVLHNQFIIKRKYLNSEDNTF